MKNLYWQDLEPADEISLRVHPPGDIPGSTPTSSYYALRADGSEAAIYWDGQNSIPAQHVLNARVEQTEEKRLTDAKRWEWDLASGIRERLALLAALKYPKYRDTERHAARVYRFEERHDRWLDSCGGMFCRVREGSVSLEKLAARGVSRRLAMALIGYPEDK